MQDKLDQIESGETAVWNHEAGATAKLQAFLHDNVKPEEAIAVFRKVVSDDVKAKREPLLNTVDITHLGLGSKFANADDIGHDPVADGKRMGSLVRALLEQGTANEFPGEEFPYTLDKIHGVA